MPVKRGFVMFHAAIDARTTGTALPFAYAPCVIAVLWLSLKDCVLLLFPSCLGA